MTKDPNVPHPPPAQKIFSRKQQKLKLDTLLLHPSSHPNIALIYCSVEMIETKGKYHRNKGI